MRVLIVEDEKRLAETVRDLMEMNGFTADVCYDGESGLDNALSGIYDVMILDVMLPRKDGLQICREIRDHSSKPVIMISAKGETFDKVLGLELGADDYIVKPLDMKEVFARVKAVLRRYAKHDTSDGELIKFDNLEISLQKYELRVKGKIVDVPPKELELIYFLASNYNHVFTRDQLLDKVWGFDYLGDSRTVDVHVKRLREKLEGVSDKWVLKTVWGVGYKFELLN